MLRDLLHLKICSRTIVVSILFSTLSIGTFCQTITKTVPATVSAGSGDTSVQVYGDFSSAYEKVWVQCGRQSHQVQRQIEGKAYFLEVLIPGSLLQKAGKISIATSACPDGKTPPTGAGILTVTSIPKFKEMAPFGEALVGVDVSAASSVSPGANLLALGVFDIPLSGKVNMKQNSPPVWVSGQLGLKGMAQPSNASGAASASYYATAINATPDKVVQSVDASLHIGFQFFHKYNYISTFDTTTRAGNTDPHTGTITTLSLIAGGGAVTPLSFSQLSPQVFEATPLILQDETPVAPTTSFAPSCFANPTQTPTCFVIFVPRDRTHFYRYYEAGFRLKLYGNDNDDDELRFPAILDLTVGQNEYVTGGDFQGVILHLGGSFPIPRADSFYFFGSIDMGLSNNEGGGPELQLIPAPVTTGLTAASPSVYTILTSQPNRDRYQFGFGIDAIHFFTSLYDKKSKNTSSP
jgi:hypothetical protein